MAKKSFVQGIDAILGGGSTAPQKKEIQRKESTPQKIQEKTLNNEPESRTTIAVPESVMEKLKAIAFWERANLKETIQKAFEEFISTKNEKQLEDALKTYRSRKGR